MNSRSCENDLKLLLIRRVAKGNMTFEAAMVAYEWFDYYALHFKNGQQVYNLTEARVLKPGGLDESPPPIP